MDRLTLMFSRVSYFMGDFSCWTMGTEEGTFIRHYLEEQPRHGRMELTFI